MVHVSTALARSPYVRLSLWAPPGDAAPGVVWTTTLEETEWLAKLMARGGISHWLRSRPASGMFAAWKLLRYLGDAYRRVRDVDVYHVNWMQCALPLPADGRPALITVLGNDMRLLRLPWMCRALRRAFHRRRVVLCPNASWMEAPLNEAFGDLATVVPLPFGIDPRWYAIRRDFGDRRRPHRWLAVTRLTADKLGPLFEWSEPLFRSSARELHLFGPMQERVAIPDWVHYHGSATPQQLAEEWFPQAAGLITLSRHAEGRPQVMLEAMAAGLPIIASDMPAHADIVTDGVTGALCKDVDGYAQALHTLEDPQVNHCQGAAARIWAAREIGTWDDCAERYVCVYRQLLEVPVHG